MTTWISHLAVAAALTAAIGLLASEGWPGWVMGAVMALSLAVGTLFGSRLRLPLRSYAVGALVTLVTGYVMSLIGGFGFWPVGAVFGIVLAPVMSRQGEGTAEGR